MKTKLALLAISFLLIFLSCDKASEKSIDADLVAGTQERSEQQVPPATAQAEPTDSTGSVPPITAASNVDWNKKIIKTAVLKVEVADMKQFGQSVRKTIKQYGGYIAQEQQTLSDEISETFISIKVPVAQFEDMMDQLPGTATKILERNVNTNDVTGQVVDTRSRLEAKKQMRLKYLEFLKQSKNMAEVLQVQEEINGIQEEIEAAVGRVSYLSQQSAYSTINLSFFQINAGFKPVDVVEPSFFTRLTEAFSSGVKWLGEIFIGLISIWPIILILTLAVIFWKKTRTRKPIQQNA